MILFLIHKLFFQFFPIHIHLLIYIQLYHKKKDIFPVFKKLSLKYGLVSWYFILKQKTEVAMIILFFSDLLLHMSIFKIFLFIKQIS